MDSFKNLAKLNYFFPPRSELTLPYLVMLGLFPDKARTRAENHER